ncbi:MAG: hypothetical protein HGA67_02365 [Candidatus Yonathbacteria bacterium]|nr:hypothetical protein [Candidatus Yonathbacteria bacterium]
METSDSHRHIVYVTNNTGELFNAVIRTETYVPSGDLTHIIKGKHVSDVPGLSVLSYLNGREAWHFQGAIIELTETFGKRQHVLILGKEPLLKDLRWYPPPDLTIVQVVDRLNITKFSDMVNGHIPGTVSSITEHTPTLHRPLITGYIL